MHNERLTLATLCDGAVQEKVDRALEKVAKNILDPNTDPGKKRRLSFLLRAFFGHLGRFQKWNSRFPFLFSE